MLFVISALITRLTLSYNQKHFHHADVHSAPSNPTSVGEVDVSTERPTSTLQTSFT